MISQHRKLLTLAWIQAWYYASTGLWPIFEIDSFMRITGPKTDLWLVRTVGALLAVTGGVLGWAARRKHVPVELVAVAVGQAVVLAAIDVVYVSAGRISPLYLLDAAAEVALVLGWILWYRRTDQ